MRIYPKNSALPIFLSFPTLDLREQFRLNNEPTLKKCVSNVQTNGYTDKDTERQVLIHR